MPVETQKLFSLWDSIKLDNFDDVGEIGVNSSGTTAPRTGHADGAIQRVSDVGTS